jgi:hypothetical protein
MDLNEYGGACRCLLRLRENEGKPGISDRAFIGRYLPRYPEWQNSPGATDVSMICELARDLGLAAGIEVLRDYDSVLREHQAGHSILVITERAPDRIEPVLATRRFVMLATTMDEAEFTLWCPYVSGQSDLLPSAARQWWDKWLAIGLVLRRPSHYSSEVRGLS